jgi:hypothetical protein
MVCHRTDEDGTPRAGFDWGNDSVQGGRDDKTPPRCTHAAMRRVQGSAVHSADLPALRRGEPVCHSPPEREVCEMRPSLLRHAYSVNEPRCAATDTPTSVVEVVLRRTPSISILITL